MNDLNKLAAELHAAAVEKGFWAVENAAIKHIAKMLSELGEAVQADRVGIMYQPEDSISGKPEGVAVELGDFLMMALDFCAVSEIDVDTILSVVPSGEFSNRMDAELRGMDLPMLVLSLDHALNDLTDPEDITELGSSLMVLFYGVPAWLEQRGHDVWAIIREKMERNSHRPKLHGRLY